MNIPEVIILNKSDYEKARKLYKRQFIFKDWLKCLSKVINEKYDIDGYVSKPFIPTFPPLKVKFYHAEYHFCIRIEKKENIQFPKKEFEEYQIRIKSEDKKNG